MTSSYTGMLLAGMVMAEMQMFENNRAVVDTLAQYCKKLRDGINPHSGIVVGLAKPKNSLFT